jgi:YVTN family beta-propeller protein
MYVTNSGSDSVSIIDTNTNTVVGDPIAVGASPQDIANDPAHGRMYVTNFGSDSISIIDTNSNLLVGNIAINSPLAIAYDLLNSRMYVTSINSDTISVLDTGSNKFIGYPIVVGKNPKGVVVDYENGRIFSANHASASVSVIQITPLHTSITSVVDGSNKTLFNGSQTISNQITFSFASLVTQPSTALTYECKIDALPFTNCSSPMKYENLASDQTHTFELRIQDELGNFEAQPTSFTWTIITPTVFSETQENTCVDGVDSAREVGPELDHNPYQFPQNECSPSLSEVHKYQDPLPKADIEADNNERFDVGTPDVDNESRALGNDRFNTQIGTNQSMCLDGTYPTGDLSEVPINMIPSCDEFNNTNPSIGQQIIQPENRDAVSRGDRDESATSRPGGDIPMVFPH